MWKSDDPEYPRVDVYGSLAELERDFGRAAASTTTGEADLHRPYIDELTRPNPDDPTGQSHDAPHRGRARRLVRLRLDAVRPGALPVREPRLVRRAHSPADFIVEYIGQTRGWFYVHARAVHGAVRPPGVHERDQPRHRARQRRPEDVEVAAQLPGRLRGLRPRRLGCDALVPDVVARAARRQPRRHRGGHPRGRARVHAAAVEHLVLLLAVRQRGGGPDGAGYEATWRTDSTDVLDRYLLAKTRDSSRTSRPTSRRSTRTLAAAKLRDFADVLTNWYVRRSPRPLLGRRRDDGATARRSTRSTPCSRPSPASPRRCSRSSPSAIWQGLTGGRSVHLDRLAGRRRSSPRDDELVAAMDRGPRDRLGRPRAAQAAQGLRVRLPLARLTVVVADAAAPRAVRRHPARRAQRQGGRARRARRRTALPTTASPSRLTVNARAAGPRLGKRVQQRHPGGQGRRLVRGRRRRRRRRHRAATGEYELVLETAGRRTTRRALALLPGGGFVLLDTATTPELEAEGLARDVIRAVQDTRKAAGFDVSDRIRLDAGLRRRRGRGRRRVGVRRRRRSRARPSPLEHDRALADSRRGRSTLDAPSRTWHASSFGAEPRARRVRRGRHVRQPRRLPSWPSSRRTGAVDA